MGRGGSGEAGEWRANWQTQMTNSRMRPSISRKRHPSAEAPHAHLPGKPPRPPPRRRGPGALSSHFSPFCSRSGAADSGSGRMGSRLTTFHSRFGRICSRLATFCSEPGANSSEPGAKNRHLGAKSSQLARPEPQAAIRLAHRGHQTKRAGKPPPVVATGAALRPPGWPWACGCRGAAPTWPPAASSGFRPCRTSASAHSPARPPPSRRCPVR